MSSLGRRGSGDILSGGLVFVGTRVPVRALFDYLEGGESLDEFLHQFPSVKREFAAARRPEDHLFPSRVQASPHISTRQYARVVRGWVREIGLDTSAYGTHTMRRTKASLIYKRTKNLRVVQLLLGHSKLESTVRYLGIEVDDALEMAALSSGRSQAIDHSR
jgi:site-specific recombinase XerD